MLAMRRHKALFSSVTGGCMHILEAAHASLNAMHACCARQHACCAEGNVVWACSLHPVKNAMWGMCSGVAFFMQDKDEHTWSPLLINIAYLQIPCLMCQVSAEWVVNTVRCEQEVHHHRTKT